MKKKLFSVLFCAIMVTALLPTTALADGPAVFVGDADISAGDYWCNDGAGGITTANASADNYNVHYDPTTSTLTLKGADITKNYVWDEDDDEAYESICAAAVYADRALTINLMGANTLSGGNNGDGAAYVRSCGIDTGRYALTISGSGSLTATGGAAINSYGVYSMNVTISGGTVIAAGAAASVASCGVYGGNVTISAGTVNATGGSAAALSCGVCGGNLVAISGGNLTATGGTATGEEGKSVGVYGDLITISGGSVTAYGNPMALHVTDCLVIAPEGSGRAIEYRYSDDLIETGWNAITKFARIGNGELKLTLAQNNLYLTSPSIRINEVWIISGTVSDSSGTAVTSGVDFYLEKISNPVENRGTMPQYKIYAANGDYTLFAKKGTQIGSVSFTVNDAPLSGQNITLVTPVVTSVSVSPAAATLLKGESRAFTAAVTGTNLPTQTVNWTVEGGAAGTTIDENGNLAVAANETASTLTVKATSTVDAAKSGTAVVTVKSGYTVTFDGNGGAGSADQNTINGKLSALPTASRSRYSFTGWYTATAGGTQVTTDTVFTADTTVYAHWSYKGGGGGGYNPEPDYLVTKGAGGTWTQGTSHGYSFTVQAPLHKFISVLVDGVTVDAGKYDKREGSTIITLHGDYLASLSVGTHTLRVNFTDGYAEASFTVKAAADFDSPATGDSSHVALWMALLFLSGGTVTVLGIAKKRMKAQS